MRNEKEKSDSTEQKEGQERKDEIGGRPVNGVNIICSKHGVINQGSYFIRYTNFKKDPDDPTKTIAVDNSNVFCMACLNEMYQNFQKQGLVGTISLNVDYADNEKEKSTEIPVEEAEIKEQPESKLTKKIPIKYGDLFLAFIAVVFHAFK